MGVRGHVPKKQEETMIFEKVDWTLIVHTLKGVSTTGEVKQQLAFASTVTDLPFMDEGWIKHLSVTIINKSPIVAFNVRDEQDNVKFHGMLTRHEGLEIYFGRYKDDRDIIQARITEESLPKIPAYETLNKLLVLAEEAVEEALKKGD